MRSSTSNSERPNPGRLTAADRPGVAQPVPERPVPDRPFGRILVAAAAIAAMLMEVPSSESWIGRRPVIFSQTGSCTSKKVLDAPVSTVASWAQNFDSKPTDPKELAANARTRDEQIDRM